MRNQSVPGRFYKALQITINRKNNSYFAVLYFAASPLRVFSRGMKL